MNIDSKLRTKIELTRRDGLCKLIREKIKEEDLLNKIKNITKAENQNINILNKFSKMQLMIILEQSPEITKEDINECYEQYRYGLKPRIFYIFV